MSNLQNYRIIEKANFYVQKKTKIGWMYKYDFDDIEIPFVFTSAFLLVSLIMIAESNWYILTSILILMIKLLIIHFNKENFNSFKDAEEYIKRLIVESENKKYIQDKNRNKKVHYLDIKIERREKLKNIK